MVFFRNVIKAIRLHCHSLPSSCTGRTLAARDTAWRISGGTQFDYGLASGATVFTGSQVVSSGGTAVHDTISGGTVVLETGAVASGGITFASSGTLEVFGSAMPSATISGFTSGDIIDLAAIASGAGGRAVLASGNVLDVLEGGSTYALQLNPSQSFSGDQFVVTSDGSGGTDVTVVPFSATVSSGTLPVSSGHSSNSVHVLSGAILNILSGGTAVGTFVNSGGTDRVSGTETSATLNGGTEIVSRTGVASGTTVLGHSSQTDLGKTVATFSTAAPRSSLPAVLPATPPSTVAARCLFSAMALPIRRRSTVAARRPSARAAPTSARISPGVSKSTPGSPAAR
jgi:autotransporter passenger strand-loop-strand repeat protein